LSTPHLLWDLSPEWYNAQVAITSKELERIFKALANKRRIEIIRFVRLKRESTVGDIAEETNLSFKGVSKHMRILYSVGILEREQNGSQALYKLPSNLTETVRKAVALI
ncbi:metalloregulator ArsR/SmtB family transcription factor, partial [Patescibacteria group bacterium]|nr:metalloregulator ArsR/SmtB family transcription factor [Patescibacteria group bacterium]